MDDAITTARLAQLFNVTPKSIADLGTRGIIEREPKRGTWWLQASVSGYCRHLREQAAGSGGDAGADARSRLGEAQASLAEARAERMRGEEVAALWTRKLKGFRARILAIPERLWEGARRMASAFVVLVIPPS